MARGTGPISLLRVFQNSGARAEVGCSSYSCVLRRPLVQLLVVMADMGTEEVQVGV